MVGTCALGLAPEKGAVVDADLKVYGVKGLRVADSSVIPHIPGNDWLTGVTPVLLYSTSRPWLKFKLLKLT